MILKKFIVVYDGKAATPFECMISEENNTEQCVRGSGVEEKSNCAQSKNVRL